MAKLGILSRKSIDVEPGIADKIAFSHIVAYVVLGCMILAALLIFSARGGYDYGNLALPFLIVLVAFMALQYFVPAETRIKRNYQAWCEMRRDFLGTENLGLEKGEQILSRSSAAMEKSWAFNPGVAGNKFRTEEVTWAGCDVILTDRRAIVFWLGRKWLRLHTEPMTFSLWDKEPSKNKGRIIAAEIRCEKELEFAYFRFKYGITNEYLKIYFYPDLKALVHRFAGIARQPA